MKWTRIASRSLALASALWCVVAGIALWVTPVTYKHSGAASGRHPVGAPSTVRRARFRTS